MSGVDELVAFLRAALDRDEQVAREAGPGPWLALTTRDFTGGPDSALDLGGPSGRVVLAGWFDDDPIRPTEAEHIARWDPARVLAEVQAKQRILDPWLPEDQRDSVDDEVIHYQLALDDVIRLLAQPYAGQPGWREEWCI